MRQLIEPALALLDATEREAAFAGAATLARALFDPLADETPADPTYGRLHGLYWLIANLAAEQPLALVIDDAQWADSPSLRFLAFVLARLDELPLALIVALRTADPGAERPPLATLGADPAALCLRPRPLSEDAVAELVTSWFEAEPAPEFTAACHAATAGNPFYLGALLRELEAQAIAPRPEQAQRVRRLGPRAVSRAVLMRLSQLSDDAPALARAAAVLGDGAELTEAAELAQIEPNEAAPLADQLVHAAVLRRAPRLEFVHPIVREAVYADLGPRERVATHGRAARALAGAGAPSERVAAQLLEAETEGDAWVVEQLREAARQATSKGAPEVAARYLRRASKEPPRAEMRARVRLELGTAAAAAGEPDALERLQDAFELTTRPDVLATAAFELSRALLYFGRPSEAVDVLKRARSRLGETDPGVRNRLDLELLLLQVRTDVSARPPLVNRLWEVARAIERSAEAPPELLATLALEQAETGGPADEAAERAVRALADGSLVENLSGESPALYYATCALTLTDRAGGRGGSPRQGDRALPPPWCRAWLCLRVVLSRLDPLPTRKPARRRGRPRGVHSACGRVLA